MANPRVRKSIPLLAACCISLAVSPPAHAARSWDEHSQRIVSAFPALLPRSPSTTGYREARCARSESPGTAVDALGCRDRDGVLFQVIEFRTAADVADFVATHQLGPANPTMIEDGTTAQIRVGKCHEIACFVITFEAPDRERYLFLVAQKRTTIDKLLYRWWPDADFTAGQNL